MKGTNGTGLPNPHAYRSAATVVFRPFALSLFFGILAWVSHATAATGVTELETRGGRISIEVRTSASGKDGKVRWKKVGERAVVVEFPKFFMVDKIQDVNTDGVIEIWGVQSNPDELYLDLYQFDIRNLSVAKLGVHQEAKLTLSAFAGSRDSFAYVKLVDLDGDGRPEVIVRVPTHPLFWTLYSAGRLYWEDVYQLDPWAHLANDKYRGRFEESRREINQEIARLLKYAQSLDDQNQRAAEPEKLVYEVRAQEARDQVRVYREWLTKIDKIAGR